MGARLCADTMKIYKRHDPSVLMANPRGVDKGPNGRVLCRWCGTETKPPRRCWCSDECVHEFRIRSNAGYARQHVYRRDKGRCELCGRDCSKISGALRRMPYECRRSYLKLLGLKGWRSTLWEVDHTIPVVEGGGSCGLENLRTLCFRCHKGETRKLRVRLARKRRRPTLKDRARGL